MTGSEEASKSIEHWADELAKCGLLGVRTQGRSESVIDSVVDDEATGERPVGESLTATEWVMMAHGLAQAVAIELGLRILSLKGPVVEHYALRFPRPSSDADVWISDDNRAKFISTLESMGWEARGERGERQVRLVPAHSVTYFHPDWPVDIDVHWWFPGIGVEGSRAFELFWKRRSQMVMAGVRAQILSKVDAAIIQMLHCVRELESDSRRRELEGAVSALIHRGVWRCGRGVERECPLEQGGCRLRRPHPATQEEHLVSESLSHHPACLR